MSPATLAEDLGRRDFSVNALAVGLTGDDLGHLYDPCGGVADMQAGLVRVLHEGSFLDDPTRLLRAVRYATRLGFELEPETERLAREAVAADALATVSGARIRDELMDLLRETDAPRGIERLRELEIHSALHPELDPDPELVASAALGAVAIGADRRHRGPGGAHGRAPRRSSTSGWRTSTWSPASATRPRARRAWRRASPRRCVSASTRRRSLRALLAREPLEALALALALRAPAERSCAGSRTCAGSVSRSRGADLLAAGVPEGPAIGRALEETLRRKLDGLVSGRDEELETALLLAREPAQ